MSEIDAARELTRSDIEVIPDGQYLSNDHRDVFVKIRDMKQEKIRAFQNAEGVDKKVSDAVTAVLKMDVAICDVIINTDFESKDSVDSTLSLVKSIVMSSARPDCQEAYVATLTDNEASMELLYSKAVCELQEKIKASA